MSAPRPRARQVERRHQSMLRPRRRTGLLAELLEARQLLVAGYTATLSGNTASFVGTPGAETLVFGASGGLLTNNQFDLGVDGFNSPIDFDSTVAGDQTISASDPTVTVVVDGMGGDDSVTIGTATAPASQLATPFSLGNVATATVDDSASFAGQAIAINASQIAGLGGGIGLGSGIGRSVLNLGSGDDAVSFADGAGFAGLVIDGGPGTNTLDYSAYITPVTVDLSAGSATGTSGVANFRNVTGGSSDDVIVGDAGPNVLDGGPGADEITGGPGADTIRGGDGDDTILWNDGDGSDTIDGGNGVDQVVVTGSAAAGDQFLLQAQAADPSRILFQRTNLGPFSLDIGTIESLSIFGNGGSGDDLTVDFSNGNPIPSGSGGGPTGPFLPGDLSFDGGGDGSLNLTGSLPTGPFASETYNAEGAGNGAIALDGSTISFSGLSPLTDTTAATNYTFTAPPFESQSILLTDGPSGTTRIGSDSPPSGFEQADIANKTNVTITGTNQADTFTLNNPNPGAGLASLTVNAGNGDDRVIVDASGLADGVAYTLNGGPGTDTLVINATTEAVSPPTGASGSITVGGRTINYTSFENINITTTNNAAPSLGTEAFLAVAGRQLVDTSVATFTDATPGARASDFVATIDWGDGQSSAGVVTQDASNPAVFYVAGSHLYMNAGIYSLSVSVRDLGSTSTQSIGGATVTTMSGPGSTVTAARTVDVLGGPISAQGATVAAREGSPVTALVATFRPGELVANPSDYLAVIDWGDGTPTSTGTIVGVGAPAGQTFLVMGTHTFASDGTYPITVQITSIGGNGPTAVATGVANVADILVPGSALMDLSATVGTPASVQPVASFRDAGTTQPVSAYSAQIDWGDGSALSGGRVVLANGNLLVQGSHVFDRTGTFNGNAIVHASGGATTTIPFTATAAAPLVQPLNVPATEGVTLNNVPVAMLSAAMNFPDPEAGLYRVLIDWGDGTAPTPGFIRPGTGSAPATIVGSHTYAESGNYQPRVTLGTAASPGLVTQAVPISVADVPITLIAQLDPSSDTGVSNSDGITRDNTPTYYGSSEPGSVVEIVTPAGSSSFQRLATTTADSSGQWSATVRMPLQDGTYTNLYAMATDRNGVTKAVVKLPNLVVDTAGPKVTDLVFDRLNGRIGVAFQDNLSGLDQTSLIDGANYSFTGRAYYTRNTRFLITSLDTAAPAAPTDAQAVTATINGGQPLRGGSFTFTVRSGGVQDVAGNPLDGEFYGFFPSGNNQPGGDFVALLDARHNIIFSPLPQGSFATPLNPPGTPGSSFTISPGSGTTAAGQQRAAVRLRQIQRQQQIAARQAAAKPHAHPNPRQALARLQGARKGASGK